MVTWQGASDGSAPSVIDDEVLGDLRSLTNTGVTATTLRHCRSLSGWVATQLEIVDVRRDLWVELLEEVMTAVASQVRESALNQLGKVDALKHPDSLAAAGAELLRLTEGDSDETFTRVRRHYCEDGDWLRITKQPHNKGAANQRRLRAAVWVGLLSARASTPKRHEASMLTSFAIYIVSADNRQHLIRWLQELDREEKEESAIKLAPSSVHPGDSHVRPIKDADLAMVAHGFARKVRVQLGLEQKRNQVGDVEPVQLRWSETLNADCKAHSDAVARSLGVTSEAGKLELPNTVQGLAQLIMSSESGRLVILGRPGSGKTTLVTELAIELLRANEQQGHDEFAVVFNLARWDPRKTTIKEWLEAELTAKEVTLKKRAIRNGETYAAQLIAGQHIIPILDGFDELGEPLRALAIKDLNANLVAGDKLVLMSQNRQYFDAVRVNGQVLERAAVLELSELDIDDVARYLREATGRDEEWRPVFGRLSAGDAHAELLRNVFTTQPLMVMLAGVVYARGKQDVKDPVELLDTDKNPDLEALAGNLFDAFIEVRLVPSVQEQGAKRVDQPYHVKAKKWLGFLAVTLVGRETTDFAWWRTDSWPVHDPVSTLLGFLGFGFIAGIVAAIPTAESVRDAVDEPPLLVAEVCMVLIVLLFIGISSGPRSLGWRLRKEVRFVHPLSPEVGYTMFVGVVTPLFVAGMLSSDYGFWAFLIVLAMLLIPLLFVSPAVTESSTPRGLLRDDELAGLMRHGAIALIGCGFSTVVWMSAGTLGKFADVAAVLLMTSIVTLFPTAFGTWHVLGLVLATKQQSPWRYMRFLGFAHESGILRQSGGVYQFRHQLLQNHLAQWYIDTYVDGPRMERLRSQLMISKARTGTHGDAIERLREDLSRCRENQNDVGATGVWILLVKVLNAAGDVDAAVKELNLLYDSGLDRRSRLHYESRLLLVDVLKENGRIEAAKKACSQLLREIKDGDQGPFGSVAEASARTRCLDELQRNPRFGIDELDVVA